MSYPQLQQLVTSGHLRPLEVGEGDRYQQREKSALEALLRIKPRTYLHDYDVLFRRVSLWLLVEGYMLTNYQPHLVLARVCGLFAAPEEVRQMVNCRHALKYDTGAPTTIAREVLRSLLICFRDLAISK